MRTPNRPPLLAALVLLALGAACIGPLSPEDDGLLAEDELTFVRVAPDAPPLSDTVVSFWVKRGETREVQLRYETSYGDGKCLRLVVPAEAPLRHPDGRVFQAGDSALVTVRVVDRGRFYFHFDPAGLEFDPKHPAVLEVRHRWADPDHNGDGVVDERDAAIEERFGFWRQEEPGAGWKKIVTTRLREEMEAHAELTGFSQYALASD